MNVKVMKKFLSYVVITALSMSAIFGITFLANTYLGHGGYGMIAILAVFMLWFLYTMAKSEVESKEREEFYNKRLTDTQ
jgi:hypothetical protein